MHRIFLTLSPLLLSACVTAPTAPPSSGLVTLAISGVSIVDVEAGRLVPNQTVLIAGDRIESVGPGGTVSIPRGARVLDGTGRYLLPGLWDMHVHLSSGDTSELPHFVRHGVTGVRDMGGSTETLQEWRKAIAAGSLNGPRIMLAGPIIENSRWLAAVNTIPEGRPFLEANPRIGVGTSVEARKAVQSLSQLGVDFVKVRNVPPSEAWLALLQEAKRHDLPVVAHLPVGDLDVAIAAGLAGFEHLDSIASVFDAMPDDQRERLVAMMADRQIFYGPTLVPEMMRLHSSDVVRALVEDEEGLLDPRRRMISAPLERFWRTQQSLDKYDAPRDWTSALERGLEHLAQMDRGGVPILAGTDFGARLVYPGSSLHDELYLLVDRAGLSPAAALRTATVNAARFFDATDRFGTVQPGRQADLILLSANPLDDIRNIADIETVLIGGKIR